MLLTQLVSTIRRTGQNSLERVGAVRPGAWKFGADYRDRRRAL